VGESEAAARTMRTDVPRRRMARREERASAQKPTSGGPTTNVRVGKEAAKVSEMGGCARQR
jgi:hypothetical protein